MRKVLNVLLLFSVVFLTTSATWWGWERRGEYNPIFMERAELERSVAYQSEPQELINPGKIYHKHPYIYINERYKGVHVINNSNPANPVNEGFIRVPGCLDMAVKGDILYLDNAVDLVAFDLSAKQVSHREKNVFPEPLSPTNDYYYGNRPKDYILIEWKKNN